MSNPKTGLIRPPPDIQLANIIDKLAEFVARNGPEFEKMTLLKQQNNSKFKFLQPGFQYNDYYQYKLMEERRNILGICILHRKACG